MIDITPRQEASLPEFLVCRARSASDGRLVLDCIGGLLIVAASALFRPTGWIVLAATGMCFASIGFWGIADRELSERRPAIGAVAAALLLSVRFLAAALGVVGALVLLYGMLAITLGAWIS